MGHSAVDTFYASVSAGVVDARGKLMNPEQLVNGGRESSTQLKAIIGQEGGRASPQRNEAVYQNVCGAFGGKFVRGNSEHVGAAAKAVGE